MPKYRVPITVGKERHVRVYNAASEEEARKLAIAEGQLIKQKQEARTKYKGMSPDDVIKGTPFSRDEVLDTAAYIKNSGLDVYSPATREKLYSRFKEDARRSPFIGDKAKNDAYLRSTFDFAASRLPALRRDGDPSLASMPLAKRSSARAKRDMQEALAKADSYFAEGSEWRTGGKTAVYGVAKAAREMDFTGLLQKSGAISRVENWGASINGDEDLARKYSTGVSYGIQAAFMLGGGAALKGSLAVAKASRIAGSLERIPGMGPGIVATLRKGGVLSAEATAAAQSVLGGEKGLAAAATLLRSTPTEVPRSLVGGAMTSIINYATKARLGAPIAGATRASMGAASTVSAMRNGAAAMVTGDHLPTQEEWGKHGSLAGWTAWAIGLPIKSLAQGQANRDIESAALADDPDVREHYSNKAARVLAALEKQKPGYIDQQNENFWNGKPVDNVFATFANVVLSVALGNMDSTLTGLAAMPATFGLGGASSMATERVLRGIIGASQSFAQEYRAATTDVLRTIAEEQGADVTDPDHLFDLLSRQEVMDEADRKAKVKGAVVGISDGIGAGLFMLNPSLEGFIEAARKSGNTSALAVLAGQIRKQAAKQIGAQAAIQPGIAATGEALSQKAAFGKINWREVAEEAIGELTGGAPEIFSELRNFASAAKTAEEEVRIAQLGGMPTTSPDGTPAPSPAQATESYSNMPVGSLYNRLINKDKAAALEWDLRASAGIKSNPEMTIEQARQASALLRLAASTGNVSEADLAMANNVLDGIIKLRKKTVAEKKSEATAPETVTIADPRKARETIQAVAGSVVGMLAEGKTVDQSLISTLAGVLDQAGFRPGISVSDSTNRFVYETDLADKEDALLNGKETSLALGSDPKSGMPVTGTRSLNISPGVDVHVTDAGQYVVTSKGKNGNTVTETYATVREALHAAMGKNPGAHPAFQRQVVNPVTTEMAGTSDPEAIIAYANKMYSDRASLNEEASKLTAEIAVMVANGAHTDSKAVQNLTARRDELVKQGRQLSAKILKFTSNVPNAPDDTTEAKQSNPTADVFAAIFKNSENKTIDQILEEASTLAENVDATDPQAAVDNLTAKVKDLRELRSRVAAGKVSGAVLAALRNNEIGAIKERIDGAIDTLRNKANTIAAEAKAKADADAAVERTSKASRLSAAKEARDAATTALSNLKTAVSTIQSGANPEGHDAGPRQVFDSAIEAFESAIDQIDADNPKAAESMRKAAKSMREAAPAGPDTSKLQYGPASGRAVSTFAQNISNLLGAVSDAIKAMDAATKPSDIRSRAADVSKAIRSVRAEIRKGKAYKSQAMQSVANAAETALTQLEERKVSTLDAKRTPAVQPAVDTSAINDSAQVPVHEVGASAVGDGIAAVADDVRNGVTSREAENTAAPQEAAPENTAAPQDAAPENTAAPQEPAPSTDEPQEKVQPTFTPSVESTNAPKSPNDITPDTDEMSDDPAPPKINITQPATEVSAVSHAEVERGILDYLEAHPLVSVKKGARNVLIRGHVTMASAKNSNAASIARNLQYIARVENLIRNLSNLIALGNMYDAAHVDIAEAVIASGLARIDAVRNENWKMIAFMQDSPISAQITDDMSDADKSAANLRLLTNVEERNARRLDDDAADTKAHKDAIEASRVEARKHLSNWVSAMERLAVGLKSITTKEERAEFVKSVVAARNEYMAQIAKIIGEYEFHSIMLGDWHSWILDDSDETEIYNKLILAAYNIELRKKNARLEKATKPQDATEDSSDSTGNDAVEDDSNTANVATQETPQEDVQQQQQAPPESAPDNTSQDSVPNEISDANSESSAEDAAGAVEEEKGPTNKDLSAIDNAAKKTESRERKAAIKHLTENIGFGKAEATELVDALGTEWPFIGGNVLGSIYDALSEDLEGTIRVAQFAMSHGIFDDNCKISNLFAPSGIRKILAKVAAFFGRKGPIGETRTAITTENNTPESFITITEEGRKPRVIVHEVGHVAFNLITNPKSPTYDRVQAAAIIAEYQEARAKNPNILPINEWFATECDRYFSEGAEQGPVPSVIARTMPSYKLVEDTIASATDAQTSTLPDSKRVREGMANTPESARRHWEEDDDAAISDAYDQVDAFFEAFHADLDGRKEGWTPFRQRDMNVLREQMMGAIQSLYAASPRRNRFQVTMVEYRAAAEVADDGTIVTQHRFIEGTNRKLATSNMTDVPGNVRAIGTMLHNQYGIGDVGGNILVRALIENDETAQAFLFNQMRDAGFNVRPLYRFAASYAQASRHPAVLATDSNLALQDRPGSGAWLNEGLAHRIHRFLYEAYTHAFSTTTSIYRWRSLGQRGNMIDAVDNPARLALNADGGYVQRAQVLYLDEFNEINRRGQHIFGEGADGQTAMAYLRTVFAIDYMDRHETDRFHNFSREEWEESLREMNRQYGTEMSTRNPGVSALDEFVADYMAWWENYLQAEEAHIWGSDRIRSMLGHLYVPMSRSIENYTGGGQDAIQNNPRRQQTARPGHTYAPVDAILEQRIMKNVRRNMVARVIQSMVDTLNDPDAAREGSPAGYDIHDFCHVLDESFITEENLPKLRALMDSIEEADEMDRLDMLGDLLPMHDDVESRQNDSDEAAGLRAELDKHRIIMAFREGRPVLVQFTHNNLYECIRDAEGEFSSLLMHGMSHFQRTRLGAPMRKFATWIRVNFIFDAGFMIWNMMRDTFSAYSVFPSTSRGGFIPIYHTVRGIIWLSDEQNRREFYGAGGGGSSYYTSQSAVRRRWKNQNLRGFFLAAANRINWFADHLSPYTETGTRAGVYMTSLAYSRNAHAGWTDEQHRDWAISEARGLCDFNAHGLQLRSMTTMSAFLRGQINGTLRSFQALTTRERARNAWSAVLMITAAKMIEMIALGDDDEYWRISKARRLAMIHVKVGDKFVPIPLPQTLGVIGTSMAQMWFDAVSGNGINLMGTLKEIGRAFTINTLPSLVQVMMALKSNESSIGGDVVPKYLQNRTETSQYNDGTSQWAIQLSKSIARASGVQISPMALEYASRNAAFPGLAQNIVGAVEHMVSKGDWSALKQPPWWTRWDSKRSFATDPVRKWQELYMNAYADKKSIEVEYSEQVDRYNIRGGTQPSLDELAKDKGYNNYVDLETKLSILEQAEDVIRDSSELFYKMTSKDLMIEASRNADMAATMALQALGESTSGSSYLSGEKVRSIKSDANKRLNGGE